MADKEIERDALNRERDRLYKCRDLEISNLWQRSIFLSVFLVLCFTAYGYILMKISDEIGYDQFLPIPIPYTIIYLNGIALLLCIISFIFSIFWIMMAKGSKAWYEVYENVIVSFEWEHGEELEIPKEYIMGERGVSYSKLDNRWLCNAKAGAYSVSKINILIGQICLIIWGISIVVHISIFIYINVMKFCWITIPFSFILVLILFLLTSYLHHFSKSKHLSKIYNKKGKSIDRIERNKRIYSIWDKLCCRKIEFRFKKDILNAAIIEQEQSNELIERLDRVLKEFIKNFVIDLESIYIDDYIKLNINKLLDLGLKYPLSGDIIIYDKKKKNLFTIYLVISKKSIDQKLFNSNTTKEHAKCNETIVVVFSSFKTYKTIYKKSLFPEGIKIWIAEMPEYLFEDRNEVLICSEKKI